MLKRLGLGIALVTLSLLRVSVAHAELKSEHAVQMRMLLDGDVEVEETITLHGDWKKVALTRSFWFRPAQSAWPLQQTLADVSLRDLEGRALAFRERYYEIRGNIDFLEIPASGIVVLRYRIHRALVFSEKQVNLQWNLSGYQWNASIENIQLRLLHPDPSLLEGAVLHYQAGYGSESHRADSVPEGDRLLWNLPESYPPDEPISISINVLAGNIAAPASESYWRELATLVRVPLAALALLFVLALILLFSRPSAVIVTTSITNFVPLVPALLAAFGATHYWYFEKNLQSSADNFSGEFIVNFGLAGFVLLFAWKQRKTLLEGKRAAYFSQLAFPAVLLVAWPIAFVDRSMLIFPLLAFPVYLYWPRRKVALDFGVGAHRIAEEVASRAEVSVGDLAIHFQITEQSLLRALEQNPHLPVVVDHAHKRVLSAEAAAMREELRVCTYCGGATEILGMATLKCGYCEREFSSAKARRSEKPLPLVIETLAIFFETLAIGALFFAATLTLAILVMELMDGGGIGGVIFAAFGGAILSVPVFLIDGLASGLREGRRILIAKLILLCFAWLIAPLVVLWKLHSKRVRIFTGAFDVGELAKQIEERGEWSLKEFAAYLQTNQEDAAELAQYLAVNQIIDAVYDRRGSRLVNRRIYRDIAKEGSCRQCGGFFGVQQGKPSCHFCGASPVA
jgi:hypothetical protein